MSGKPPPPPPASVQLSQMCDEFETGIANSIELRVLDPGQERGDLKRVHESLSFMEKRLTQSILFLKTRNNRCVPIGRLSDELILEILENCSAAHHAEKLSHFTADGAFGFPPAFSVCLRWRDIAIRSPSLWRNIALPSPRKLLELVQSRNQTVPFNVRVNNDSYQPNDHIGINFLGDTIRQLATRISFLHMCWDRVGIVQGPVAFLEEHVGQREMSSLKFLKITNHCKDDNFGAFTLQTPVLESLEFIGPPKEMPRVLSEHLVEFVLGWKSIRADGILDILLMMPHLKRCMITCRALHDPNRLLPPERPVVSLNNLERLDVWHILLPDINYLLRHLNVPSSARLTFYMEKAGAHRTSISTFLGPHLNAVGELYAADAPDHSGAIYTLGTAGRPTLIVDYTDPDAESSTTNTLLLPELAKYPQNLSYLDLHVSSLPSHRELRRILTAWSGLRHIMICTRQPDLYRLLDVLEDTPEVICPSLKHLDCPQTRFSGTRMRQFLEFRKNQGHPLGTLEFTQSFTDIEPDLVSINGTDIAADVSEYPDPWP
ncbi:hypothetical protein SISSUDRAFT_1118306 [Sistotremastrum suecicum HHB10207 ss-3]|uniref:F-box domain-containing protein n=1 Tax=Sistotremastrum suecicum HHB10207 ss-3 TaxID=1314776 RepID=A0A166F7M2_9AGAM|nr:hypothetical protein SISSUDRAFT_1118306 [Sistotremastrum suecicum HHB10207 ss-3]